MNFPHLDFEKTSCKDANVEKGLLVDLFDRIRDDRLDVHSIVFVKDGNKVFDAYAKGFGPGVAEETYSISKSFTSVAIGILADRGQIALDDSILKYFPEIRDALPVYAKMTVKNLLTMTTGRNTEFSERVWKAADPIRAFFLLPVANEPGTRFFYDNTASFLLSAIVTKITGMKTVDFLDEPLWRKLAIDKPFWASVGPYSAGATGLRLDGIAMAKFGHLLLNDGVWRDERIVSQDYLREATRFQIATADWDNPRDKYGYGFQFWINDFGDYRAAGLFKQYIVINREFRFVFAVQGYEQRELLDLVSNYVLPACRKGWLYDNFTLRTYIQRFHDESGPILEAEKRQRTIW